ncbi:MAG TPA: TraB/GumN family protein [Kofleriaceae bacterium]|nr:TraB/GumN family protein [Kofleriaceae bacterium]
MVAVPAAPSTTALALDANTSTAHDPWAVEPARPSLDDPPTLAENHERAEAACPRVTRPPFYRIERAGNVNYMLGSRHVSIGLGKQPPIVEAKVRAASTVVFEVAPGDDVDPVNDDSSVPDMLGPELWQRYRKLAGPAQADAAAQRGPANAALRLMLLYEDPTQTLDHEIEILAGQLSKPTAGLESAAFQNNLIAKLLDARALRAAVQGTADRQEMQADSEKDIREYCTGVDKAPGLDADDRKDMMDAGYTETEIAEQEELLLFRRNRDWIPKLEKLFTNKDVFVVVGADHLRGDKGVLALLTKRGFKVTRVDVTDER